MARLIDTGNETVTYYPQVQTTDMDGTPVLSTSETGTQVLARVQPLSSEEDWQNGYETVERYRLRIARGADPGLGIGAEVEWDGHHWQVDGYASNHTGSPRTRRLTYTIQRA